MPQYTRGGYAHPATSLGFDTGSWRTQRPIHQQRPAPCHHACPAGEDARAYLALVEQHRYQAAWETLVAANPLPTITGRVCHHPCEQACNRGQVDEPIAIHNVERFLGDQALEQDWPYPAPPLAADAPRAAVVGAGPAGCSAAWQLRRQGVHVTLYDALPQAGGLLTSAIPPYRLPRDTLDREIGRLLAVDGIDFQGEQRLGHNLHLEQLQDQYPALFLGLGQQLPRPWQVDGAAPEDLHQGLDLLREWLNVGLTPPWKSVAVVGAGNTAVDVSRVLKRAGVPHVHLISHKAIPGPDILPEDTMPAIPREIQQALEEGVEIHQHRGIQRLVLRGEKVTGIEVVHMKKLRDTQGRLRRVAFEGTETILPVDQVIPAIGQILDHHGLENLAPGGHLPRLDDLTGALEGHPGLYSGGDLHSGHGSITEAVGDGRRAALAMARQLGLDAPQPAWIADPIPASALNLNYFEPGRRPTEALLPPEQRGSGNEVEQGLTEPQIRQEGNRCLCCGDCLACDNCWTLCPDLSVLKTRDTASDGSHYVFDYGYCKGCGLCAHECPTGYILMQAEE